MMCATWHALRAISDELASLPVMPASEGCPATVEVAAATIAAAIDLLRAAAELVESQAHIS